jgi:uncharacterized protein
MVEQLKETRFEDRSYICPDANYIQRMVSVLSREIIDSGIKFDLLIALARGGWALGPNLANDLRTKSLYSIGYESYKGTDCLGARLITELPEAIKAKIRGSDGLLLEDIIDSGNTVQCAVRDLAKFEPRSISTSALFWNDKKSVIKPDFYVLKTSCWVIFPHEQGGFIQDFYDKRFDMGMKNREIRSNLCSLGLDEGDVDYFMAKAERDKFERSLKK